MVNRAHKSRESAGLGIANILAGCYGGIAGCAMIGQTIVNVEMGRARSRLSTVIAGLVLLPAGWPIQTAIRRQASWLAPPNLLADALPKSANR